ncbi:MAG: DUF423 domain-containing protein [Polaribacter sp.]|uniref:DUF423 domain-containing protein n=1 Tax=Polaribacter sp. TaxID=1920175 RepID=UPI00384E047F
MNENAIIIGGIFGFSAILLGAFGAHLLKKKLNLQQLQSFETGVKYQMYHAIVLLILGFQFPVTSTINNYIVYAFIIGTVLFSFSIYALVLLSANNKKLKFLGPITPLGGLFLALGWGLLVYKYMLI